jgi:hypothetical protein
MELLAALNNPPSVPEKQKNHQITPNPELNKLTSIYYIININIVFIFMFLCVCLCVWILLYKLFKEDLSVSRERELNRQRKMLSQINRVLRLPIFIFLMNSMINLLRFLLCLKYISIWSFFLFFADSGWSR